MQSPSSTRHPCPPGTCICDQEELRNDPHADLRILRLTREEEKKLLERLETMQTYADLLHMQQRMHEQLGLTLNITPSTRGVRTIRGLIITLIEQRGLCRKTRQSIPAAIRKCIERQPSIAYELLDAHDLLGQSRQ